MNGLSKSDLLARLNRVDEDAYGMFGEGQRFRVVIVGGCALILLNALTRATQDIDVLSAPQALLGLLKKYDIDTKVSAYLSNYPYNFEDRLQPVKAGGQCIDFYTASLEDIVVAKLCSNRDTDRQDIIDKRVVDMIDWGKLHELVTSENESVLSSLNRRQYMDLLDNYNEYVRRYGPCDGSRSGGT